MQIWQNIKFNANFVFISVVSVNPKYPRILPEIMRWVIIIIPRICWTDLFLVPIRIRILIRMNHRITIFLIDIRQSFSCFKQQIASCRRRRIFQILANLTSNYTPSPGVLVSHLIESTLPSFVISILIRILNLFYSSGFR